MRFGIAVFPGSETFLLPGLEKGGAGCISATCNINPGAIRRVFDIATSALEGDLESAGEKMLSVRKRVEGYAPIPAMKGLLARVRGDTRWANVRPPLLPATRSASDQLFEALEAHNPDLIAAFG